jgi:hypothetical protein
LLFDLIRALPAAVLVGVVPGWFWAKLLRGASADRAERFAYSVALSITLVPAVILIPTRLFDTGVTLAVAVAAPLVVFFSGLAAYLRFGPAKGSSEPLAPPPTPLGPPALVLLVAAFGLTLGVMAGVVPGVRMRFAVTVGVLPGMGVLIAIALLVFFAGIVHLIEPRRQPVPQIDLQERLSGSRRLPAVLVQHLLLPAVLALTLLRGYLGPVVHDWPFIRGVDHYSHAVMAELMMSKGKIEPYLIYPPGFHAMTAEICRLTGLEPLEVFPVVAPTLLLLPALGCYALALRLWGWHYGVVAALLSGLILGGSYLHFAEARYANFIGTQFLVVVAVAALVGLYAAPSVRGGILLALLGSSTVLYHQIAGYSLAVLLAVVGLVFVPYLLVRDRRKGVALLLSLGLLGFLSTLYAWDTYDLPRLVAGLLGGSETGRGGEAVAMAIGTKPAYDLGHLLATTSQPVAWLGLLGALLAIGDLLRRRAGVGQTLAYLTLLLWALLLFAGSRTPLTGFPQRFGRDLGIPLAVLAALAFVAILRSLLGTRKQVAAVYITSLTVLLTVLLVGTQMVQSLERASRPSIQLTITPKIAAAGEWLREHNDGGNIMISPHVNQVPSRMMLAMGGYSALQSFADWQIRHPRDLPPTGSKPLKDVLWVLHHPKGERTDQLLQEHDVRYIVLYKKMPDRPTIDYWKNFRARPDLYQTAFENEDVLIVTRGGG